MAKRPWLKGVLVIIACIACLAVFTILLHTAMDDSPFGADFYTFWLAAKSVFIEHTNPYSDAVTQASQMGIYGRLALPGEDQVAFAYPPFSLMVLAPAAWMTFDWAQAYWLAFGLLVVMAALVFGFGAIRKKQLLAFLAFYPVVFGLILGNFAVLLGSLFAVLFFRTVFGHKQSKVGDAAIGFALAWTAFKPQFAYLFILFLLLWSLKERRYGLAGGFLGGLGVWLGVSWLMAPGWLPEWLNRVGEYAGYVQSQMTIETLLAAILPDVTAHIAAVIIAGLLGATTVLLIRMWWQGRLTTLAMLAWLGWLTYLLHPHGIAYEQIAFLVPLLLWMAIEPAPNRLQTSIFWFGSLVLSWVCFALGKWSLHVWDAVPVLWNGVWMFWLMNRSQHRRNMEEA